MNGSFGINYDVNLPEINEYLSFPASKSVELSFGGSNSNRNYYYSVVIEDKDGYYFRVSNFFINFIDAMYCFVI